ncbi:MAG: class I SAM-dependent methyltransferase [Ignavibacteriales bacterium]|nr:MAG: class I SAM-dependent methyltransferase [Ignavibacteriales bacterium]
MNNTFRSFNPNSFNNPEKLPQSQEERDEWLKADREFWENNPMRYDWHDGIERKEFTKEFYDEIDKRFFENVKPFAPWKNIPFDDLIPFNELRDKKVLEIGVGNGSHAQLLSQYCADYTGIDITDYAIKSTSTRLKINKLNGNILQMNAEEMKFENNSFDFIWSWGVIHHTANTFNVLKEMNRVLKPGGKAVVMVYHRGWFNYYLVGFLFLGLLKGDIFKTKSLHKTVQNFCDGALARFYTPSSWEKFVSQYFRVEKTFINGNKAEILPIPASGIKSKLLSIIPDSVSRFMTKNLRMGSFLISRMNKK